MQDYASVTGLLDRQLNFVHGNFNDALPFADESFDALYQARDGHRMEINKKGEGQPRVSRGTLELCVLLCTQVQVLTYTVEPLKLFREIFRVLRPGAKISFLDWVQLPNFNASDVRHQELLRKVKPLLGAVWTPKVSDFLEPLREAGFQILSNEEASRTGSQYTLFEKLRVFFEGIGVLLRGMTKIGLLPKHFETLRSAHKGWRGLRGG